LNYLPVVLARIGRYGAIKLMKVIIQNGILIPIIQYNQLKTVNPLRSFSKEDRQRCELITVLKVLTPNKKGWHLSTKSAFDWPNNRRLKRQKGWSKHLQFLSKGQLLTEI
jgi:hypothetical protein